MGCTAEPVPDGPGHVPHQHRTEAAGYPADLLLTLAEIAQVVGKHVDTVKDYRKAGRWPNAAQDTTGRKTWRVPVADLVAADDLEPAQVHAVEPALAQLRETKQVTALRNELATLQTELAAARAQAEERARTIALLESVLTNRSAA